MLIDLAKASSASQRAEWASTAFLVGRNCSQTVLAIGFCRNDMKFYAVFAAVPRFVPIRHSHCLTYAHGEDLSSVELNDFREALHFVVLRITSAWSSALEDRRNNALLAQIGD